MCRKWAEGGHLNPSGVKVTTVEFPHQPAPWPWVNVAGPTMPRFDLRGGPEAVDHVDIMGNEKMLRLLVKAAAGVADEIEETVSSNIAQISEGLAIDANGGVVHLTTAAANKDEIVASDADEEISTTSPPLVKDEF